MLDQAVGYRNKNFHIKRTRYTWLSVWWQSWLYYHIRNFFLFRHIYTYISHFRNERDYENHCYRISMMLLTVRETTWFLVGVFNANVWLDMRHISQSTGFPGSAFCRGYLCKEVEESMQHLQCVLRGHRLQFLYM